MDVDPAFIATVAASSANKNPQNEPVTLGQLVYGFAVVFGVAGVIVWSIGVIVCK